MRFAALPPRDAAGLPGIPPRTGAAADGDPAPSPLNIDGARRTFGSSLGSGRSGPVGDRLPMEDSSIFLENRVV